MIDSLYEQRLCKAKVLVAQKDKHLGHGSSITEQKMLLLNELK